MRIIISPAKKMNVDTDSMPVLGLPVFLAEAEMILNQMRQLSEEELRKLWKCNDSILRLNMQRLKEMGLRNHLTPAILSYEGIQYQYMAPGVFSDQEFQYVQERLRILSGFYGLLRPFDGVFPYRLEMQAKLQVEYHKDLYSFWGRKLCDSLISETETILNLASKEYSICISRYLPESVRFLTCIFGEEKNGNVIEKGTLCKMARGEMVRWLAENMVTDPDEIKLFNRLNYQFSELYSRNDCYVFLKKKEER